MNEERSVPKQGARVDLRTPCVPSLATTAHQSSHSRAVLVLLATAVLWSTGGLFLKWVDWNALAITSIRSGVAAAVIFALSPSRPLHFRFSRLEWAGGVAYAGTVASFVIAIRSTTAANAIFLQYTAPIYIALLGAWFLGERPRKLDWVLIVVGQLGAALFFLDQFSWQSYGGNALALLSGFCYASMTMLLRKQRSADPSRAVLLGNAMLFLIGLPFISRGPAQPMAWVVLIGLGIFQLGIPYLLYSHALKQVKALEATLILLIEPILNPIWVMLFLKETPGPWAILGAVLVLATAIIRALGKS